MLTSYDEYTPSGLAKHMFCYEQIFLRLYHKKKFADRRKLPRNISVATIRAYEATAAVAKRLLRCIPAVLPLPSSVVAGSKDSHDSTQRKKVEYGALMRYVVPA
jgi:hypothetical protein